MFSARFRAVSPLAAAAALLLLAGCAMDRNAGVTQPPTPIFGGAQQPPPPPADVGAFIPPATALGCAIRENELFYVDPNGRAVMAEATSRGAACLGAPLTLTLRAPTGEALYSDTVDGAQMFLTQDVRTPEQMRVALQEWIAPPAIGFTRTADLPRWRSGATGPDTEPNGFPFIPATGLSRSNYEALRRARRPMFCYVKGMESLECLALIPPRGAARSVREGYGGRVVTLGRQIFPG